MAAGGQRAARRGPCCNPLFLCCSSSLVYLSCTRQTACNSTVWPIANQMAEGNRRAWGGGKAGRRPGSDPPYSCAVPPAPSIRSKHGLLGVPGKASEQAGDVWRPRKIRAHDIFSRRHTRSLALHTTFSARLMPPPSMNEDAGAWEVSLGQRLVSGRACHAIGCGRQTDARAALRQARPCPDPPPPGGVCAGGRGRLGGRGGAPRRRRLHAPVHPGPHHTRVGAGAAGGRSWGRRGGRVSGWALGCVGARGRRGHSGGRVGYVPD